MELESLEPTILYWSQQIKISSSVPSLSAPEFNRALFCLQYTNNDFDDSLEKLTISTMLLKENWKHVRCLAHSTKSRTEEVLTRLQPFAFQQNFPAAYPQPEDHHRF